MPHWYQKIKHKLTSFLLDNNCHDDIKEVKISNFEEWTFLEFYRNWEKQKQVLGKKLKNKSS